ncbi:hypothetical protein GC176_06430 [bacterium]|nr:hypothetical protein [bacterium]
MPDLVTHLASGYVVVLPLRDRTALRLMLLAGVLLPDLLTRPFYIIFPGTYDFVMPMHTPIGYAIACWLMTQLFSDRTLRNTAMTGLLTGGLLHFAADSLQKQLLTPYLWLFPVCRCEAHWGLFWPEAPLRAVPFMALLIIVIHWTQFRTGRSRRRLSLNC